MRQRLEQWKDKGIFNEDYFWYQFLHGSLYGFFLQKCQGAKQKIKVDNFHFGIIER